MKGRMTEMNSDSEYRVEMQEFEISNIGKLLKYPSGAGGPHRFLLPTRSRVKIFHLLVL